MPTDIACDGGDHVRILLCVDQQWLSSLYEQQCREQGFTVQRVGQPASASFELTMVVNSHIRMPIFDGSTKKWLAIKAEQPRATASPVWKTWSPAT